MTATTPRRRAGTPPMLARMLAAYEELSPTARDTVAAAYVGRERYADHTEDAETAAITAYAEVPETVLEGYHRDLQASALQAESVAEVKFAVMDAAAALLVRHTLAETHYDLLTHPLRLAGVTVHPDDTDPVLADPVNLYDGVDKYGEQKRRMVFTLAEARDAAQGAVESDTGYSEDASDALNLTALAEAIAYTTGTTTLAEIDAATERAWT